MHSSLSFKQFKKLSYFMAALFLAVHIVMLCIFWQSGVMPMCAVNLCSIAFYCAMLFLIHRDHLRGFVVASFLEICLHMGLAEYYTGWNSDFQITLIGICVLLFYAEYIGKSMHVACTPAVFLAPAAVLAYLVPLVIDHIRPAPYQLPSDVEFFFRISWAVILFGIVIPILRYFVYIATRSQEELTNEVLHDKLTGLPNRYYMSDFFRKMSADVRYWIAIADIDGFKNVNDTYGHNCGDYVLSSIAKLIMDLPSHIAACRWGGEEFLLAGKLNETDPAQVLESLRKTVAAYPFRYEDVSLRITVTIGAAWFAPGQSIDEWINEADTKLYTGKTGGKNRVVI